MRYLRLCAIATITHVSKALSAQVGKAVYLMDTLLVLYKAVRKMMFNLKTFCPLNRNTTIEITFITCHRLS